MNKPTAKKAAATPPESAPKRAPKRTRDLSEIPPEPTGDRPKKTAVPGDIRRHVAATLRKWMNSTPALDSQVKVGKAANVGQTTVSRILNGSVPATLDVLDAIAKAFGRDVSDLLSSQPETKINYDPKKFARLPDYEKVRVEAFIEHVLREYENPPSAETKNKTPR